MAAAETMTRSAGCSDETIMVVEVGDAGDFALIADEDFFDEGV